MMTYGQRFRQIRKALWADKWQGKTIRVLAARMGFEHARSLYNLEVTAWRPPTLPTIAKHAEALNCQPWELLEGVETEYDMVKALKRLDPPEAARTWANLLTRYDQETARGSRRRRRRAR